MERNQELRRLGVHLIDAEINELARAAEVKLPRYEWDFFGAEIDAISSDGARMRFKRGTGHEGEVHFLAHELELFPKKPKPVSRRKIAETIKRWS